jgi:hypothetical protein
MAPIWDPEENKSNLYEEVEQHSDGMISVRYRPPSNAEIEALKNTRTYRNLIAERAKRSPDKR